MRALGCVLLSSIKKVFWDSRAIRVPSGDALLHPDRGQARTYKQTTPGGPFACKVAHQRHPAFLQLRIQGGVGGSSLGSSVALRSASLRA